MRYNIGLGTAHPRMSSWVATVPHKTMATSSNTKTEDAAFAEQTALTSLLEILRDGQPWKSQGIQHLPNEQFDVEYHPDYLLTFFY